MSEKQYMTIDGIPVEINGEKNILELCQKIGVKMPTFCYHSDLSIYGACRMCMVENKWGGIEAACSTPPRAGMEIKTNTQKVRDARKTTLELILSTHDMSCLSCARSTNCELRMHSAASSPPTSSTTLPPTS